VWHFQAFEWACLRGSRSLAYCSAVLQVVDYDDLKRIASCGTDLGGNDLAGTTWRRCLSLYHLRPICASLRGFPPHFDCSCELHLRLCSDCQTPQPSWPPEVIGASANMLSVNNPPMVLLLGLMACHSPLITRTSALFRPFARELSPTLGVFYSCSSVVLHSNVGWPCIFGRRSHGGPLNIAMK